jgi:hypothetical protein
MKFSIKTPDPNFNDHEIVISGMTTGKLMALKTLLLETNAISGVQREVRSFLIANITNQLRGIENAKNS